MLYVLTPTDRFLKAAREKNYSAFLSAYVFSGSPPLDVNTRDQAEMPALYYALRHKHFGMIRFLLNRKADVDAICEVDGHAISLIEYAEDQGLLNQLPRQKVSQYRMQNPRYVCGR